MMLPLFFAAWLAFEPPPIQKAPFTESNPLRLTQILPTTPVPGSWNELSPTHTNYPIHSVFDAEGDRVISRLENEFYAFDLESGAWTHLFSLDLDARLGMMAYDPETGSLLLWDSGVGRVYRVGLDGTTIRVDHSFNQMNQFGHSGAYDPTTGRIYAVGGYGLFTYKNMTTVFDRNRKEWDVLNLDDGSTIPPYFVDGHGLLFPDLNKLYVVSQTYEPTQTAWELPQGRVAALWGLDIGRKTWTRYGVVPLTSSVLYVVAGVGTYSHVASTHPTDQQLAFFGLMQGMVKPNTTLYALDGKTGNTIPIPYTTDIPFTPLPLYATFWDGDDSRLVVVSYMGGANPTLTISQARIDAASLVAQLNRPRLVADSSRWIWAVIPILVLFGAMYYLHRRHLLFANEVQPVELPVGKLRIEVGPPIRIEGCPTNLQPVNGEAQLLTMLMEYLDTEDGFVLNDDIDRRVVGDHPSPDYVRKLRNKCLSKLENRLQALKPLSGSASYIERRTHAGDNRKMEYRLNPLVVERIS